MLEKLTALGKTVNLTDVEAHRGAIMAYLEVLTPHRDAGSWPARHAAGVGR